MRKWKKCKEKKLGKSRMERDGGGRETSLERAKSFLEEKKEKR